MMKRRFFFKHFIPCLFSLQCLFSIDSSSVMEEVFTRRFGRNSGMGSTLEATFEIREQLPKLLKSLNCRILLDLPCGDFVWMQAVDLPIELYMGGDCIKPMIDSHNKKFGSPSRNFLHVDACVDMLPRADVVLCRDMLVHLSFRQIFQVLSNLKKSGSKYLLVTHFTNERKNTDIPTGGWRHLNFTLPPFNFPEPLYVMNEKNKSHGGAYSDKSLALWEIACLPDIPQA